MQPQWLHGFSFVFRHLTSAFSALKMSGPQFTKDRKSDFEQVNANKNANRFTAPPQQAPMPAASYQTHRPDR